MYSRLILVLVMLYNIETSNFGFIDESAEPKQDDINKILFYFLFYKRAPTDMCCFPAT